MTMLEATQLSNIYNTLLQIKTSGKDTVLMGKCLETFERLLTTAEITMVDSAEVQEG